jgi:hypothetical protein
VISFRARHRQVVRQARRDQIRREVREAASQLRAMEAGEIPGRTVAEMHQIMGTAPGKVLETSPRAHLGADRETLLAVSACPRPRRRELLAIWTRGGHPRRGDRQFRDPRQQAPWWAALLLELAVGTGSVARWLEVCPFIGGWVDTTAGMTAPEALVIPP